MELDSAFAIGLCSSMKYSVGAQIYSLIEWPQTRLRILEVFKQQNLIHL